jgi:hypothetical protein
MGRTQPFISPLERTSQGKPAATAHRVGDPRTPRRRKCSVPSLNDAQGFVLAGLFSIGSGMIAYRPAAGTAPAIRPCAGPDSLPRPAYGLFCLPPDLGRRPEPSGDFATPTLASWRAKGTQVVRLAAPARDLIRATPRMRGNSASSANRRASDTRVLLGAVSKSIIVETAAKVPRPRPAPSLTACASALA